MPSVSRCLRLGVHMSAVGLLGLTSSVGGRSGLLLLRGGPHHRIYRRGAIGAAAAVGMAGATTSSVWCAGPTFQFDPDPSPGFSPLYEANPRRLTASTNAGDYLLYVGGGAINMAFLAALQKAGLKCEGRKSQAYSDLHKALLRESRARKGALVSAADVPDAAARLSELKLAAAFGRKGDELADLEGLEGSTGSVFIDVCAKGHCPLNKDNVAMLYVVGPKGLKCRYQSAKDKGPYLDKKEFLESVQRLGKRALESVKEYNQKCKAFGLPPVEELRWCLVSGGVYCHGDCSRLEVAEATLKGMQSVTDAGVVVTFSYADDAFRLAAQRSRL